MIVNCCKKAVTSNPVLFRILLLFFRPGRAWQAIEKPFPPWLSLFFSPRAEADAIQVRTTLNLQQRLDTDRHFELWNCDELGIHTRRPGECTPRG